MQRENKNRPFTCFPRHVCQYKTSIPYALFHTTRDSLYWSLMPWHLESVADAFRQELINSKRQIKKISDRTAHIGVDLLHLSQLFPDAEMEAYEKCPDTFRLLKNNISRLGQHNKKWSLYNACGASQPPDKQTNLVYLDPNWGGSDYKNKKMVQLCLGQECVSKVISKWLLQQNASAKDLCICLKAPVNWPVGDLFQKSPHITFNKYCILNGNKISYVLYFFYREK